MKKPLLLVTGFVFLAEALAAAGLTNADIIKMTQAKLDPAIVITAIENSEAKFDVSPQGLIELSSAQVPQPVIAAMLKRGTGPATPATAAAPAAAPADTISPSDVMLIDGEKTERMRYLNPQMRTAARAMGLGGAASYAVLRGNSAQLHIANKKPTFLVSVPDQAQPESYITIASFAVRPNGSREVMVGGGYMSYSTGIHSSRVMPFASEKAADQSKAQKGFSIYKVTPTNPLAPGQYALILYTGEMQSLLAGYFAGSGNSYFDFAID